MMKTTKLDIDKDKISPEIYLYLYFLHSMQIIRQAGRAATAGKIQTVLILVGDKCIVSIHELDILSRSVLKSSVTCTTQTTVLLADIYDIIQIVGQVVD